MAKKNRNFEDIDMKLCHFCGTCIGICPTGALEPDPNSEKPRFIKEKCIHCGLCYENCPGIRVDFEKLKKGFIKAKEQKNDEILGPFIKTFIAHSTDKEVRKNGTSGGMVTQLLVHLLKNKKVDGVIIPRPDPDKRWVFVPTIVDDIEEVKRAAQSKYCLIPTNEILRRLRGKKGDFAIVLLPCQIHSIRKLQQAGNREALKLKYILGLVCGYNMLYAGTVFGMKKTRTKKEQIKEIKYRDYGSWPGGLSFYLKDGTKKGINFFNYHYLNAVYLPRRCRYCPDFFAEYSDISFADSWLVELLDMDKERDEQGIPLGWSSVIARTPAGIKLLQESEKAKEIVLKKVPKEKITESFPFNIKYKKRGVFTRMALTTRKPSYNGLKKPEIKAKEKMFHSFYYVILVVGGSKPFKFFINIMPMKVLVKSIYWMKKAMGYPPNARDQVVKHDSR